DGAGYRKPLGAHDCHRHLYRVRVADVVDPASVPRIAKTGTGVSEHHPYGPTAFPASPGGAGLRTRAGVAIYETCSTLAAGAFRRSGFPRDLDRRAMAFCNIPDVAGREQLVLRH